MVDTPENFTRQPRNDVIEGDWGMCPEKHRTRMRENMKFDFTQAGAHDMMRAGKRRIWYVDMAGKNHWRDQPGRCVHY
jgi:hypothetical protein